VTESLERLENHIAWLTGRVASIGVLLILCIAFLTLVDVFLRWAFSAPLSGLNEIIQLGMAVAIAATFPAGASSRINLTIDILERRISSTSRKVFDAIGSLLLLLLFVLLSWRVGVHAFDLHERGSTSLFLEIPRAPFIYLVTLLFVFSSCVQFVVFLVDLSSALAQFGKEKLLGWVAAAAIISLAAAMLFIGKLPAAYSETAIEQAGFWVATLFILLWVMVLGFVPIAVATALTGLIGASVFLGNEPALSVLGTGAVDYLGKTHLAVLPLFLLMGGFAVQAGFASDMYRLLHVLMSRLRGGLAMATIGGCAGFGALTGSSIAVAATMGQVALPEMQKRGYSQGLAAGSVAAGGTLGALIPPSTLIILYAVLTEESIGQLFIAAIIPAILAVSLYFITVALMVSLVPGSAPTEAEKIPKEELREAFSGTLGVVFLFSLVLGGLYGGVFTVTESASVGACGAFLLSVARGKLGKEEIWQVLAKTTGMTAMVFLLIIGASNFSFFVAISGLPELVTTFFQNLNIAPLAIIGLILLVYVLLGSVIDPFPIIIITVPIVAPVIADMGYSLIWWGIVMVSVVETGMITPPFGINVFVLKNIAGGKVPLSVMYKGVLPFVVADLVRLALLVLFPMLILWLPSTM
jgi:tripartite ATP-independent transporter DctM subunit